MNIFFSIIIPTYNRAVFIKNTIDSVLSQRYTDFEIIIVDDGSKDNTSEVIKQNFGEVEKIIYLKKENGERGLARNYGLGYAKGTHVVFFDSDDLMHENHLATLAEYITKFPTINFFASKYDFIRGGKNYPSDMAKIPEGKYNVDLMLEGNFLACNFCIKRDNPNLHLFEPDRQYAIMEDWMFLVQNLATDSLYIIDRTTISMNDHDTRSMRSDNSLIIAKRLLATEWLKKNVALSPKQIAKLYAHSYFFCAVHAYIDGHRKEGISYLKKAIANAGLKPKFAILFIKLLIGRENIIKLAK
jgi:GalNAc5-diNAcBac-PP-undecaprenol beta-1,3-glucosyltransferase